jgi:hypothetical protein
MLEHQYRDVAVAGAMTAWRSDDGADADFAPRQVIAAELDAHGGSIHFAELHFAEPIALGYAMVGGEHQAFVDQRAGAREAVRDDSHDGVVRARRGERYFGR